MRRLFKNSILFILPVLAIIILLPENKRYAYIGLKNDCFNHGLWIYDRIHNNPAPVDMVFMGSSHTLNSIDDKLLAKKDGLGQVANLGYCRYGRNLAYILLKELLTEKKPRELILEVRENENRYSHPIFPFIAGSRDVLLPNPLFNRDILKDIWTHFAYKIELAQDVLYHEGPPAPVRKSDYGYSPVKDTVSFHVLQEAKKMRSNDKPAKPGIEKTFHSSFARGYLRKIHRLCKKHNISQYFLYIPSYGTTFQKPSLYDTYQKYGKVLIPPDWILDNPDNWADSGHLNKAGGEKLSEWLAGELVINN